MSDPKDVGATAPALRSLGGMPKGRCASICARVAMGFCLTLLFCLSVSALALAARVFRPEVLISPSASGPAGYTFGGAVYQGSGYWVTTKPVLPAPRSDLGVVASGTSSIFLMGGQASNGSLSDAVWEFNAVHERYNTTRARMPEPRYRFGIAAAGGRIYVLGGTTTPDGPPTSDCRVYTVASDAWATCAPMPGGARIDLAAAALDGRVYAVGGYDADFNPLGRAEVFTPGTNTWAAAAPLGTPRGDLAAVAFSGRVWALGGWSSLPPNDRLGAFQAGVESLTPGAGSWSPAANMLVGKGDLGAAMYRGQLVTVGGEVSTGTTAPCYWDPAQTCAVNQVPTHDAASFIPDVDPASGAQDTGPGTAGSAAGINGARGVWTSHAPMPGARFRFAAASNALSQALFVFGGTREGGEVVDAVSAFYDTAHPPAFVHYRDGSYKAWIQSWF